MARLFDNASSEYLSYAGTVYVTRPFTMAAWFYADESLETKMFAQGDTDQMQFFGLGVLNTDYAQWHVRSGGTSYAAESSNTFSINSWHHACGVETASDDRTVYLDGGNSGTNSNTVNPTGIDNATIGALAASGTQVAHFSGRVAECGLWSVALTADEVTMLASGIRPIYVRPQNLVMYVPLWRDEDEDYVGGVSFTATNGPTVATHPPIIFSPPKPSILIPTAADVSISVSDGMTIADSPSFAGPDVGIPITSDNSDYQYTGVRIVNP